MNTKEVANRLVELCRSGDWEQAQNELYSENVVSIEPKGTPVERVEGIAAVKAKGAQWAEMVEEMHRLDVSDAQVADSFFTCVMELDTTFKGMGRQTMEEVCLFEVKDGKIVKEEFFYTPHMPG